MGIKSKSNANNTQSSETITIKGLVFQKNEAYERLVALNAVAPTIVDLIKNGCNDMDEYFSDFEKVKVKELYPDAAEYLEFIFDKITIMYSIYDRDYFGTELDFAKYFYSKIDIESYDD